jgi:transposase InsO family protein
MKRWLLFSLFGLFDALSLSQPVPSNVKPVTRVVMILESMLKSLEAEQKSDEEIREKMDCWCTTDEKSKKDSIEQAEENERSPMVFNSLILVVAKRLGRSPEGLQLRPVRLEGGRFTVTERRVTSSTARERSAILKGMSKCLDMIGHPCFAISDNVNVSERWDNIEDVMSAGKLKNFLKAGEVIQDYLHVGRKDPAISLVDLAARFVATGNESGEVARPDDSELNCPEDREELVRGAHPHYGDDSVIVAALKRVRDVGDEPSEVGEKKKKIGDGENSCYIPSVEESTLDKLVDAMHKELGHGGIDAVLYLFRRFNLRGAHPMSEVRRVVERVIKKCPGCQLGKPSYWKTEPGVTRGLPSDTPLSMVGIYFTDLTPLELKLCVIVCLSSKRTWAKVVTDSSAATVVTCLLEFIGSLGAPRLVLSDQALVFKSAEVMSVVQRLHIRWRYTAAYRPWGNGIVERKVQTLKAGIRSTLWSWIVAEEIPEEGHFEYMHERVNMATCLVILRCNLLAEKDQPFFAFDYRLPLCDPADASYGKFENYTGQLRPGDRVLVRTPGLNPGRRLDALFSRTGLVIERVGNSRYSIDLGDLTGQPLILHESQMKKIEFEDDDEECGPGRNPHEEDDLYMPHSSRPFRAVREGEAGPGPAETFRLQKVANIREHKAITMYFRRPSSLLIEQGTQHILYST